MALTADIQVEMMFPNVGYMVEVESKVADSLYKGALLNFDADGYPVVAADTVNHTFAGICAEVATVVTGGINVKIIRNTVAWIAHTGAAVGDVGAYFHASADDTISDGEGTYVQVCGKAVEYESGYLKIDFSDQGISDLAESTRYVAYTGGTTMVSGSSTQTGHDADIDTGLTTILRAWVQVKDADQGAGDAAYCTIDHGADGLLDIYAWDDAGVEATVEATIYWFAIGTA